MRILHTSDWHLGKKLNQKSRIDEQVEVIGEIASICECENIDVVIVAGDIYDTFTPSAQAEELFFKAISSIATSSRAVVLISGNHDDAKRLCAPSVIADKVNVYILGDEQVYNDNGFYPTLTARGKYHCAFEDKNGQKLYIGALPYPSEQRLNEADGDLPYSERVEKWMQACFEGREEGVPCIFISHLFMLGGVVSDGERSIELGGARAIDKNIIPGFCNYTALGHLHKRQVIDSERNIIYSGSPLQYSFDEAGLEKSVTVFDIDQSGVSNLKKIGLKSGKQLVKLVAADVESAKALIMQYSNCLISLTLKTRRVLSESESREISTMSPALVEFKLEFCGENATAVDNSRREMSSEQLFKEYYKSKFGDYPDEELVSVYNQFMKEE